VTSFLPSEIDRASKAVVEAGYSDSSEVLASDVRVARSLVDLTLLRHHQEGHENEGKGGDPGRSSRPRKSENSDSTDDGLVPSKDTVEPLPLVERPSGVAHLAHILRANVGAAILAHAAEHESSGGALHSGAGAGASSSKGSRLARECSDLLPMEGRLARAAAAAASVLLVEHGSPSIQVNAVRRALAAGLRASLATVAHSTAGAPRLVPRVIDCAMERRDGAKYDYCNPMLEDVVGEEAKVRYDGGSGTEPVSNRTEKGTGTETGVGTETGAGTGIGTGTEDDVSRRGANAPVVLAMQFALPGKHAGAGGDVAEIVEVALADSIGDPTASRRRPILTSPLVAEHPALVDLLVSRIVEAAGGLEAPPVFC